MKKDVNPLALIAGVVVCLLIIGGLYYKFVGPGAPANRKSAASSPYGLIPGKPLPTPPTVGSGRNSITGEPLDDTHMKYPVGGFPGSAPRALKIAPSGLSKHL